MLVFWQLPINLVNQPLFLVILPKRRPYRIKFSKFLVVVWWETTRTCGHPPLMWKFIVFMWPQHIILFTQSPCFHEKCFFTTSLFPNREWNVRELFRFNSFVTFYIFVRFFLRTDCLMNFITHCLPTLVLWSFGFIYLKLFGNSLTSIPVLVRIYNIWCITY